MKIKNIKVENFKGIESLSVNLDSQIYALADKNGKGKTSFLQAFNFGLTGNASPDYIRNNKGEAKVEMTIADTVVNRTLTKDGVLHFINGEAVKRVQDIHLVLNGTKEKKDMSALNIVSSNKLDTLTSSELANFLISFLQEKPTWATIVSYMENLDDAAKQFFLETLKEEEKDLNDTICLDEIKSLYQVFYKKRTAVNKNCKVQITEVEKPAIDMDEIKRRMEDVLKKEAEYSAYEKMKKQYELAKTNQQKYLAQIETLKKDLSVEVKDMSEQKKNVEGMLTTVDDCLQQNISFLSEITATSENLKKTVKNLSGNKCPFSDKVICSTDKSDIIRSLEDQINSFTGSIEKGKTQIESLKEKKKKLAYNVEMINKNQTEYRLFLQKKSQLETMQKNIPQIGEEPAEQMKIDHSAEKKLLEKAEMQNIAYADYQKKINRLEEEKKKQVILNYLVKQLDGKGPVIQKVIEYYTNIFESVANQTAKALNKEFSVKFVAKEGITVYFKFKSNALYMPYRMLSGGEKILAMFILLDLINQLTNSNIMVLDEIDVLDEQRFGELMEVLNSDFIKDRYDMIFLTMTDTRKSKLPSFIKQIEF